MRKNIIYSLVFLLIIIIFCGCTKDISSEYEIYEKTNLISSQISELKPINKANVLLTKDTALVGLDLKSTQELGINSKKMLRQEIKKIVVNTDSNIKNIFISSNLDVNKKMANISRNINKGKKVDLRWEIKNIVIKFTPNV